MRRIGVNLTWLVPGVVGGSEESTVRALEAVLDLADGADSGTDGAAPREDRAVELVLFVLPQFADAHPGLAHRVETRIAPVDGMSKARRVLSEATWLRNAVAAAGVDLVHHAGGTVPLGARGSVTLTIHDLQPLDLPANFSLVKRMYVRAMLGRSARRASIVTVPSSFTAERVAERLGISGEKVAVVPWSVPEVPPTEPDAHLLDGLALTDPVFLYPAITYPHKHHRALLYALAELRATLPDATLVFCGRPGPLDAQLRALIEQDGLTGSVRMLGRVEGPFLEALYRRATALVYPSRYEGFGLPVLEAMARGCPVIASDIPALSEVTGGAAELVGPTDLAGWARAMQAVALEPARRDALSEAGFRRAAQFDPARTAAGLLDVWDRALHLSSPRSRP